ncbi:colanic acid biosynthesis glycosyltransferase WcaL [Alteromonas sp. KUL156]|nr:colanic acid biosynthesis glycosyltransferase WcaL [Alteromonas sp. KUL154]GFD98498.1 colanic acid biosynthesis glycosyltransferase WcaL [Alteromonas sp. KUL156]
MQSNLNVAYLAPQLTALEATFIYEEIAAVEKSGINVVPFSVNRPKSYLAGNDSLLRRTIYLYDTNKFFIILLGLLAFLSSGNSGLQALRYLGHDVKTVGIFSKNTAKLIFQFFAGAMLSKELKSKSCKHLHIHFAHVATQIGMYAATMASIPFTVMAHANDIFERGLLLKEKAERAKKFFTISDYNRQYLLTKGLAQEKIAIIRCGVAQANKERKRQYSPSQIVIGSLGRLVEKKGMNDLISAVSILLSRGHNIKLLIGGEGPLEQTLKKQVTELGIASSVSFDGKIPRSGLDSWMNKLDIFILACKKDKNGDQDGIPVVLMEAMIRKVPVVATAISGIPELIVDGKTGYLAQSDSIESLVNKVELCLDSVEQSDIVFQAEQHVKNEFGRQVNLERLNAYF